MSENIAILFLMSAPENTAFSALNGFFASGSRFHPSGTESIASTSIWSSTPPSTSASSTISSVFPTPVPRFVTAHTELENLLGTCEPTSEPVQAALRQLTLTLPFHPPPQIIAGTPLNWPATVRVDAHLNSTFEEALDNIGTALSDREETFLRYIIQHLWGWSATPKQHLSASGFRYL